MTWEIVAGLITLVGFMLTVGGVVFKLSGTLTKLQATLDALNSILAELKKANADDHKYFAKKITDHECRLTELEVIEEIHKHKKQER